MKPTPEQLQGWGQSLREIDPQSLTPDVDGAQVRWFLGDNATELYAWSKPGEAPHHVQLVFARVSVEWEAQRGLVTGTFRGGGSTAGGRYDPYLLSVGHQIDLDVCDSALSLLKASTIEEQISSPLVKALEVALTPST